MDKTEKLISWEENEKKDRNRNGLDDRIEPPVPDIKAGSAKLAHRLEEDGAADLTLTAGDVDVNWANAQSAGDETPTGSMPTPDQGDVDGVGRSMGVTYQADEELKFGEKERSNDKKRFELDPASSEDWKERNREEKR
ncbi:MAG TPA: DUF6335 family protein [Thermoanaerobaculia bacterium]|nr:DUF6335 family protein [Thermoanaerobaculia bacterium]